MANLIRGIAVAAIAAACGLTALRAAEPAKPAVKQSLDDALLEGLDNELTRDLDDLPSLKPPPKAAEKPAANTTKPTPPEIDGEDLGQPGEGQDPFGHIARRMKRVESRIARDQAGADTQHQQAEIIDDLAALIEKLNQQCQCQGGECKPGDQPQDSQRSKPGQASKPGGSKSGSSPARESTTKLHNDAVAKPHAEEIRQTMKDAWGNLPQRLREQMLQTSVDEFLPKYESMIEQYFNRLAEDEKPNSK